LSATYRIPDEPVDSRHRGWVTDPFWPLLGVMLAGAWLGAAVFAFNAWSLRGPTWQREIWLSLAMLAGAALLAVLLGQSEAAGMLPAVAAKYAILLIVAWKLGLAYWIYYLQHTGFALYEYFGGKAYNGLIVVIAGAFLSNRIVADAVDHWIWKIVVS
jgi:hypothetical protein